NDSSGTPVVCVSESDTTATGDAPGYTIGRSSGLSSLADAVAPGTRIGAPRSSATAASTRAAVHGACVDAPFGGALITWATTPCGELLQPIAVLASAGRLMSMARLSDGPSHTGIHGSAAASVGYARDESSTVESMANARLVNAARVPT